MKNIEEDLVANITVENHGFSMYLISFFLSFFLLHIFIIIIAPPLQCWYFSWEKHLFNHNLKRTNSGQIQNFSKRTRI